MSDNLMEVDHALNSLMEDYFNIQMQKKKWDMKQESAENKVTCAAPHCTKSAASVK